MSGDDQHRFGRAGFLPACDLSKLSGKRYYVHAKRRTLVAGEREPAETI
jgi:hypothetical protein